MIRYLLFTALVASLFVTQNAYCETVKPQSSRKIVLVAGETAKIDAIGHHDYLAGCKCLEVFLKQTPDLQVVQVTDGWPNDEHVFDNANAIVFYTDGGGKQAFLSTPERVEKMQSLVEDGVGIVMIHQAVDFPAEFATQGRNWIGGVYESGLSGRGHWPSSHVDFPDHPIAHGATPWQINDGWLNRIQFVDGMKGITPIVWSGKEYAGSRAGLNTDIAGWAYERPNGGRSFSYTGLDAHSAWSLPGMRQLVVNGVLWSAGLEVPPKGANCEIEPEELEKMQTPREPKKKPTKKLGS